MSERHAAIGRHLQSIGLAALLEKYGDPEDLMADGDDVSARDINALKLIVSGLQIERDAAAQLSTPSSVGNSGPPPPLTDAERADVLRTMIEGLRELRQ